MKNFTIIHILLLVLMLLTYTCASGQSAEDYIVTNTMDTIYGKIKPLDYGLEPKIQLQTADKKKKVYSILDTKVFFYNGDSYYPMKNYDRYQFMKLISSGYLSLYAFQPENQNNYDGRFLQKMDGTFTEVPNLAFKKNMSKFLDDCGIIGERISSGEWSRNNLDEIISEYNKCIDNRTLVSQTEIAAKVENQEKSEPWKSLKDKINAADFEGKSTAMEIVTEIISKTSKGEKVPSFVIDGLKNTLSSQESLKEPLEAALKSLEN